MVLTLEKLSKAINNAFSLKTIDKEYSKKLSLTILNFFWTNKKIIDNIIESDDRDIFYIFEDKGILKTEREETTLFDGREWRTHFWSIDYNKIDYYYNKKEEKEKEEIPEDNIYSTLSKNLWKRRQHDK